MQLLDMKLEIPEEGETSEASEFSWAKLTKPIRKFRWRAEAVGGKQVCFDQQIWRMSRCQWATIFRCEKSFWEGARLLTDSGHKGVNTLEQRDRHDSTTQRDKACDGKVPLFIRHQASSRAREAEERIAGCDGRQTFKVLVPRAIRGLRKKVHEKLQQYLDLVDWSGIGVEDRTRECKATGEWFVTEEGRMPEALVSLAGEAGDPGSTV